MSDVLLLGIGNVLLADDGLGAWFAATFPERRHVPAELEVVDGGTLGLELLDRIAGRRVLVVVDAVANGGRAGDLVRLEGKDVPAVLGAGLSSHDVALSDLLAAATLLDCAPQAVVLHGIEPAALTVGTEFSAPVQAALGALETHVVDELARFGCLCPPRAVR
ncbi:MAG: HyaD/HybD family hydrogenase maturation endopeptidase [Vulcanimicrobiaceae bacterium]